jgi:hypothetical protein
VFIQQSPNKTSHTTDNDLLLEKILALWTYLKAFVLIFGWDDVPPQFLHVRVPVYIQIAVIQQMRMNK